jgi:hypothetical protein
MVRVLPQFGGNGEQGGCNDVGPLNLRKNASALPWTPMPALAGFLVWFGT